MKKNTKVIFLIIIIFTLTVLTLCTGCGEDGIIPMSAVTLTGAKLTWEALDGADEYYVNIMFSETSGYEISVKDNFYVVNHSKAGDYYYRVRAKVKGVFTDYSEVLTYHLGVGSREDPITIGSREELEKISNGLRTIKDADNNDISVSCYYKQTNDIDLESTEWTPIGVSNSVFKGIYDGSGYNIYNLKISKVTGASTNVAAGLFGLVQDAVIKNVNIVEPDINITEATTQISVGALVGRSTTSVIKNCSVIGDITVNAPYLGDKILYAGLIIGESRGTGMSNLYANGSLTATYSRVYAGGIVGITKTSSADIINNCLARVDITSHGTGRTESGITAVSYAGGVAGYLSYANTIEYCYYSGALQATAIDGALVENINNGMFGGAQNSSGRCNIKLTECYFNIDNLGLSYNETYPDATAIAENYTVGNCTRLKSGSTAFGITSEAEGVDETFTGFDFENTWEIIDNKPELKSAVQPIFLEMSAVTITDNIISWEPVSGASEYYVFYINEETEQTVYDTNYQITQIEAGAHSFKIAAKVIGEKTDYSDIIVYYSDVQ